MKRLYYELWIAKEKRNGKFKPVEYLATFRTAPAAEELQEWWVQMQLEKNQVFAVYCGDSHSDEDAVPENIFR